MRTTCPAHFVLDFVAIIMSGEDKLCISSLYKFYIVILLLLRSRCSQYHVVIQTSRSARKWQIKFHAHTLQTRTMRTRRKIWSPDLERSMGTESHNTAIQRDTGILLVQNHSTLSKVP